MASDNGSADQTPSSAATTMAPRLAWAVTATVFAGLCAVGFINVVQLRLGPVPTAVSLVLMAALLALQLLQGAWSGRRERRTAATWLLIPQAMLACLPLLYYGQAWVGMPILLAGSLLLVLPRTVGRVAFGLLAVVMGAVQGAFGGGPAAIAYTAVSTCVLGLAVYLLCHLGEIVRELGLAQGELAQMAVIRERLRFARDLHDLLGYSLSAMTLKAELAHRLVDRQPGKARQEVAEVLYIGRQALSDVRAVAHGYRDLSLDHECRSVRSVLESADVDLRMRVETVDLPPAVATVVATLLREGVTNLLRHSKAEHCAITVEVRGDRLYAEIANDGVDEDVDGAAVRSSGGLRNLEERAAALGGSLVAERPTAALFRLALEIPLPPGGTGEPTAAPAPDGGATGDSEADAAYGGPAARDREDTHEGRDTRARRREEDGAPGVRGAHSGPAAHGSGDHDTPGDSAPTDDGTAPEN
ncbi:two-component system sensor histidine kinase DesK [Streptomonospora nanhaiensis]|uniref:Two-component system sensor histidine kinase DesK n=1 Tax=Streptomonospora nanhaiensis TaxID=1323731 RepID=A0A853BX59_9ACTN|nr:histidine kinase [Streptomonospora nanhaiensis]NYI99071.1 two-component system sensor histidine kinase DesK [Streptomonospora nanhaiensis]